jgi:four helix bundle protein
MEHGRWEIENGRSSASPTDCSVHQSIPTMAKYERFEDLPVWQEAARLYNTVLDLLETSGLSLSPGFRNQLDRAALSVSNNIAEGFERSTTAELLSFIAIARGSAGEVRSMMAVAKDRPRVRKYAAALGWIRELAESCARQLTGWAGAVEKLPFEAQRRMPEKVKRGRETAKKATDFRTRFLATLSSSHPLYNTPEAIAARAKPSA